MGRDIGAGLTSLIKKLSPKGINGKHGLTDKLTAWEAKEINKWQKEDRQDMIEAVQDKVACIHAVIARTSVNTVPDLIREIEAMFSDDPKNTRAVTLCSVHKSKGLESDTVYFLDREIIPMKSATQAWQLEQEFNLLYVGITRAKSALYFISSEAIR
jgi:superfamily I DNA/RNA helicase